MRLDVIYQESKGVLSRAERDFYLGYCSFADNATGLCHPKMKTVAERVGIPAQSASRMYKNIIGHGFLEKTENGHKCLIGFTKSKRDVNFSAPEPTEKSSPDVNLSSSGVNSSSPDVNLHIKEGTTHLTTQSTKKKKEPKPQDPPELVAFRKDLTAYQKSYAEPTTQGQRIANANAIRALFKLSGGDAEMCITIHKNLQQEPFRRGRVMWTHVQKDFNFQKVKPNATPITNAREQREQKFIEERNSLDALRAEIDGADRQLQETDASGGGGFFRTLGPKPDDGRESLPR